MNDTNFPLFSSTSNFVLLELKMGIFTVYQTSSDWKATYAYKEM